MSPHRRETWGYRGVRPRPSCSFSVEIRFHEMRLGLGTFDTAHEAVRAYNAAAWRLRRPRRGMNFPNVATRERAHGSEYFKNMLVGEKAPIDTVRMRRSSRSTRYDGFKVPQVTDVRKAQSKVKPRGAPSVACSSKATAPCAKLVLNPLASTTDDLPPLTPIHQLQYVGNVLCGVSPDDLTPQKLMAPVRGEGKENP
nr:ethylene-responsive transcription factor 3-like [Aegilops tauschii subsp. strangulata]